MAPKLKGKKLNKKAIENTQFILCDWWPSKLIENHNSNDTSLSNVFSQRLNILLIRHLLIGIEIWEIIAAYAYIYSPTRDNIIAFDVWNIKR